MAALKGPAKESTIRIDISGKRPKTRIAEEQADDLNNYLRSAVQNVLDASGDKVFDWEEVGVEEIDPNEATRDQITFARLRGLADALQEELGEGQKAPVAIDLMLDGEQPPKLPAVPKSLTSPTGTTVPKAERHQKGWLYQVNLPVTIRTRKDRKYCARKCGGYKPGKLAKNNSVPYCGYFAHTVENDRRCNDCLARTGDV